MRKTFNKVKGYTLINEQFYRKKFHSAEKIAISQSFTKVIESTGSKTLKMSPLRPKSFPFHRNGQLKKTKIAKNFKIVFFSIFLFINESLTTEKT